MTTTTDRESFKAQLYEMYCLKQYDDLFKASVKLVDAWFDTTEQSLTALKNVVTQLEKGSKK